MPYIKDECSSNKKNSKRVEIWYPLIYWMVLYLYLYLYVQYVICNYMYMYTYIYLYQYIQNTRQRRHEIIHIYHFSCGFLSCQFSSWTEMKLPRLLPQKVLIIELNVFHCLKKYRFFGLNLGGSEVE